MSYASDALIDTLERQVKKTKAENDKLRKTVTMLSSARTDLLAENATLRQQLADVTENMGRVEERCAKLRKLMARMAKALGIDCEWADPDWCKSPCVLEFGCWPEGDHTSIRCPAWAAMQELGVEV